MESRLSSAHKQMLLVEDSAVESEILRRILAKAGYLVKQAKNGKEGLLILKEHSCSLVISDIQMPLMDGYELCREIKHDEELWKIPVILVSTLSESKDILNAINVGADGYLTKPCDENVLLGRIHSLLAVPLHRSRADERRVEQIEHNGNLHSVTADSRQLLNLLLSVYENTLSQNHELVRVQSEINLLNNSLESQVQERTSALEHTRRALAAISAVNRQLVYATDENALLQAICQAIMERGGYRMVWVGYVQHDESKSVKNMAYAGYNDGYLENIGITWAESERGMGPTGRAIRSGTTQLCQDFINDPRHQLWSEAAKKNGFAASISLPMPDSNGQVFGALMVYAKEVNAFTAAEVELLEEMAGDLAFGVRSLHIRQERDNALAQNQHYLSQLQDTLEGTVRTIASIVEMRDPYTAGHQARVANLAVAIAGQMGLSAEQIQTIHLAGIVHDLGKIKIPAEILSKPGKISELEFQLIKTHAQASYDILKDINFPWPIAQIALQHHERVDGSGYPQGLRGDAFMLEARILSVADVVEAMSSHRPYRPALGTAAALEEISRQRGIYFDPQVVDACLVLFKDKGFAFNS